MIQLFVNVDEQGNILQEYSGENIVAENSYDFWFLTTEEIIADIGNLKVVVEGMKPKLVPKDAV